jgi:hypothetical protein
MPTCGDTDKSGGLSASSRSAWIAGSSPATTTIYFFIYFLPCGSALAFTCASSLPSLSIADLSAAISRGGEIAGSGGDFRIGLAVELERLLQKLDIGLQAGCAAIHLLLGGADLEPANVLRRGRRQRRRQHCGRQRQASEFWRPRQSRPGATHHVTFTSSHHVVLTSHHIVQRTAAAA